MIGKGNIHDSEVTIIAIPDIVIQAGQQISVIAPQPSRWIRAIAQSIKVEQEQ